MTFVLDNSVALTWCFEDEQTPASMHLLDRTIKEGAVAPALWPVEAVNTLLVAERRRRLTRDQRIKFIGLLSSLPVAIDHGDESLFWPIQLLAERHNLTAYDASYLAVALRLGLPLATRDKALVAAAATAGVRLLETL